jgi:Leucine-rich repeat (LRR) protein
MEKQINAVNLPAYPGDLFVPIPDEEFRRMLTQNMKIPVQNGGVYYKQIKQVTVVDVSKEYRYFGPKIASLSGIEYFTNLEILSCSYNSLSTLDLFNNVKLKKLHCPRNSLIRLNVTRNLNLKYLSCYANFLSELDVFQNAELMTLYCNGNKIRRLDLSNNHALLCQRYPKLNYSHNDNIKVTFPA